MLKEEHLQVGYSCNNNCIHCFNKDIIDSLRSQGKPIDRTTEEIKQIISEAKEKGAESLTFTGGEPTIRKDFFELLEFAKNMGFKIGLQTNGRMFCSREFAERTLQAVPDIGFTIPLHHARAEAHDKITQVKGSWEQTMTGIKNLTALGSRNITIKTVLLKQNFESLTEIVNFAYENKLSKVDFTYPQICRHTMRYARDIIPRYTEIKDCVFDAVKKCRELNMSISLSAIPFCFAGGVENYISELNYVKNRAAGENLERTTLTSADDIIQDLEISRKSKSKSCKQCRYFYVCEGVWKEYIQLYGAEEFKPVPGKQIKTMADLENMLKVS